MDFSSIRHDVISHGLTQPGGRRAVEKGHFGAVFLLEEAVQGSEHDGHGELVGVDEGEGLERWVGGWVGGWVIDQVGMERER